MFREELISAYHQRGAKAAAKMEREVREYISCVFGAEWATQAEVNGYNVKIGDIELFVDRNSYKAVLPNSLLLLGQCPRCGEKCWSRPCFSAAGVGEQLVDFQASLTRHTCPKFGKFLRHLFTRGA